jgi:hypothetical protein
MARGTSSKKVARAARAGGGRVRGAGQRGFLFPATLTFIVVTGLALIVFARAERREATAVPPRVSQDHWHAAYTIYVCDEALPPILEFENPDNLGIHTHGDGVIHIHPFSENGAGRNATLGKFLRDTAVELSDTRLVVGGETYENGDDCGDKPGRVVVAKWDSAGDPDEEPDLITENVTDIRFRKDAEAYTIAFVPEGTEIPKPETATKLEQLGAVDSGAQPSSTTTAPAATTTTGGQDTTTTAGATTTTPPG